MHSLLLLAVGACLCNHRSRPRCTRNALRSRINRFSARDPESLFEHIRQSSESKQQALTAHANLSHAGLTLLVGGALILLLGYLVPRKDVIVGYQEEIAIIDESAVAFNKNFEWFKILGLGVFCVGGLVLSTALLLPSLVGTSCFDEDADEATPFKVRIGRGRDEEESDSDDDHKAGIPATETVKGVQPRREEEAVITKGALTQLK